MNIDFDWIKKAVETVLSGFVPRLDSNNKTIKVYRCGTIIRIDISPREDKP